MYESDIKINNFGKYLHASYNRDTYEIIATPKLDIIEWIEKEEINPDLIYSFMDKNTGIEDKLKINFKDFRSSIETQIEITSAKLIFDTIESRNLFKLTWG